MGYSFCGRPRVCETKRVTRCDCGNCRGAGTPEADRRRKEEGETHRWPRHRILTDLIRQVSQTGTSAGCVNVAPRQQTNREPARLSVSPQLPDTPKATQPQPQLFSPQVKLLASSSSRRYQATLLTRTERNRVPTTTMDVAPDQHSTEARPTVSSQRGIKTGASASPEAAVHDAQNGAAATPPDAEPTIKREASTPPALDNEGVSSRAATSPDEKPNIKPEASASPERLVDRTPEATANCADSMSSLSPFLPPRRH